MPLPAQIKPDTRTAHIEDNMLLSKRLSMVANAIPESQLTPGALANPNSDKRIIKPLKSPIPPGELSVIEKSKQLAAWTAVDQHVKSEYRVIGIGSGTNLKMFKTATPFHVHQDLLYLTSLSESSVKELRPTRIVFSFLLVKSSHLLHSYHAYIHDSGFQSKELIVQSGLTLGDVDQYPTIDVTIDGADEVDVELNCIKGGGACHLREKVIAEAALTWALYQLFHTSPASKIVVSRFILVADYRKNVEYLGTTFKAGVPIEVVPFAYAKVLGNLHTVIGSPKATLRMAVAKGSP
ncbi:ribose-5-phosphate isomerase [Moniliophthora roreri]|nr:ribose-5-phosphate isomerase [Moniliophthora roreri]